MQLFSQDAPIRLLEDGPAGGSASPPGPGTPAAPAAAPTATATSPSSPSSTPATPKMDGKVSGEVPNDKDVDDFSGLGLDDLEELPPEPKPAAKADAKPEATPPEKKEDPAALKKEEPKAESKPAEAGGQKDQQPPSPSEPPKPLAERVEEHRGEMIKAIAEKLFTLSKEQADAFELDAVKSLPQLGAQIYYESVKATLNHIENFKAEVPRIIEHYLNAVKARDETSSAFYGKFPALDKAKHDSDVMQFAIGFRQANPKIDQDSLWAMTAAAVAAKHGLTLSQVVGANGSTPPAPRPPAQQPFVPARAGVVVRSTPEPENEWLGLGADDDD